MTRHIFRNAKTGRIVSEEEAATDDALHVRETIIDGVLTRAADDVLAERQRQVAQEGWSESNDDEYRLGELAAAAACYCHPEPAMDDTRGVPFSWPWNATWWKPTDRRRNLVKAGALILAEIERLDRMEDQ